MSRANLHDSEGMGLLVRGIPPILVTGSRLESGVTCIVECQHAGSCVCHPR